MLARDLLSHAGHALTGHPLRTGLSLLGIGVGVAAVVLLTGLGEGARRYVTSQFSDLGSNLIAIMPGKVETKGIVPLFGGTTRELTLADARAVRRRCRQVRHVSPLVLGAADAELGSRSRSANVLGTTREYFDLRSLKVSSGTTLPDIDLEQGMRVAVIGRTVQRELFREENPLGKVIRLGQWRFRVVGVLEPKGRLMGMDIDDLVLVPVATGMQMFDRQGLFRLLMSARSRSDAEAAMAEVRGVLRERHDGDEDFTMISQGAMMGALDSILEALGMALVGIAAISLSVAGIGIMNVMLVSVTERTSEIGLMKSVGATDGQIMGLFLLEAASLALAGGVLGTLGGFAGSLLLSELISGLDARPPGWAVIAALATAVSVGITFGLLPARQAARLDPVAALSGVRR